jgi:hypothetical protein
MKKLVQALVVLLVMSVGMSMAQADRLYIEGQTRASMTFSSGASVSLLGALGVKNLAGPLGLRGLLALDFAGGASFTLGADALFTFGNPRDTRDAEFYAGPGLRIFAGSGGTAFGLNGVAGVEFPLNPRLSVNAEFVPILLFGSGTQFIGQILAGFRIYP